MINAFPFTPEERADIEAAEREIRLGKVHTISEWDDLEADGVLCLGFARGQAGSHAHWPTISDPALGGAADLG